VSLEYVYKLIEVMGNAKDWIRNEMEKMGGSVGSRRRFFEGLQMEIGQKPQEPIPGGCLGFHLGIFLYRDEMKTGEKS